VALLRAPGTEVQGVNSQSFGKSLRGRSAVRPLAAGGVTALLGTLVSCGYGSGYSFQTVNVPNSIAVADVNGDGVPDLLVATTSDQGNPTNPGFANVILGVKASPGTYQKGTQYSTSSDNPSSIAVADLTGSGSLDLVIASFSSGSVSIFMHGSTPGSYMPAVTVTTGGLPNQVVIADVNGDGHPDLVLADSSASGNAIVVLQDPANPGRFLAPTLLSTGSTSATSVAVADLNGDGKPDVVAATSDANGDNGAVYVFYQSATSPGTFLAASVFPAGAQPQSVRIADLNRDGLPDLAVANLGPGLDGTGSAGVSVLLQDAAHPGSFLAPVTYATQARAIDVAVGDLNGDGKPDLVVANLGPAPTGSVSVLLQDPAHPGVFLSATSYGGFGQPLSVAIADLNGDGHPDIAVADSTSATIMLQNATAPGTFAAAAQVGN
jgi:FG-GAP-like repeat/FG-GAP repeat